MDAALIVYQAFVNVVLFVFQLVSGIVAAFWSHGLMSVVLILGLYGRSRLKR